MPPRKKTDAVEIAIPRIEMISAPLTLVGRSSLIVHAWSQKAITEMLDKQKGKAKAAREKKDPEADFLASKYLDTDGRDCIPAIAIKNAIRDAASFASGVTKVLIRGAVFVEGELLPLRFSECRMRQDIVRVGMGTADVRFRAEYLDWEVDCVLQHISNVMTTSQAVNLLDIAGQAIGLCEWRPQRNGVHGTFSVKLGES